MARTDQLPLTKKICGLIAFLNDAELLKSVTRHSWLSSGRQESVAEHSWRMAIFVMVLADEFPEIDMCRVLRMVVVHDMGEAYDGDRPAHGVPDPGKEARESSAIRRLTKPLSRPVRSDIFGLWKEYENGKTPEARLAKAVDKLEALIQHNEANISTWLPCEYRINLTYGKPYMGFHQFIKAFRRVVDMQTRAKIKGA